MVTRDPHEHGFNIYLTLTNGFFYRRLYSNNRFVDVCHHTACYPAQAGCFSHAQNVDFAVFGLLTNNGANLSCADVESHDDVVCIDSHI